MFNQPQNCRRLFNTWKPIVEALDRHHNTNQRQFGCFMSALTDLIGISVPMFDADLHYCKEPIGYCTFIYASVTPICKPDAVLVPVVDPVHGPILQVKAAAPLNAGELVRILKYSKYTFRSAKLIQKSMEDTAFSRCLSLTLVTC